VSVEADPEVVRQLRRHEATGRPAGGDRFVKRLERLLDRVLRPGRPGRKKKTAEK
jgi:putative transposase